jgi:hypothetical protein
VPAQAQETPNSADTPRRRRVSGSTGEHNGSESHEGEKEQSREAIVVDRKAREKVVHSHRHPARVGYETERTHEAAYREHK